MDLIDTSRLPVAVRVGGLALAVLAACSSSSFAADAAEPAQPGPAPQAATPEAKPEAAPASAAVAPASGSKEKAPSLADEASLHVEIAPYIWMTSYNGTTGIKGFTTKIDKSFIEILDDSDTVFGLMGAIDLQYGRFVCQVNGAWTTATFSQESTQVAAGDLASSIDVNSVWAEMLGGWRFLDAPLDEAPISKRYATVDGFVGARFTWLDVDTTVSTNTNIALPDGGILPAGASRSISDSESWVDPFVGVRFGIDLTESWSFLVRGDIGGFGVGSDFSWQAIAAIGYRWHFDNWSMALFAGYRALYADYENGGFTWDMTTHGPLLGVQFAF